MTTPEDLRQLAEEVEKLEGPSRKMDARVHAIALVVVHGAPADRHDEIAGATRRALADWREKDIPIYTSSLDAAASLMPKGWHVHVGGPSDSGRWGVSAGRMTRPYLLCNTYAGTEALARTAAALRARAELIFNGLPDTAAHTPVLEQG